MLRTFLGFVFCFVLVDATIAQTWKIDTLKATFKTRGSFDSLDLHSRTFSLPYVAFGFGNLLNEKILLPNQQFVVEKSSVPRHIVYSALPHVGFAYSFGQQGTQLLSANYQQVISPLILLNAEIEQNQFAGFQRNSAFKDLQYGLLMRISTARIENILSLKNTSTSANWSGGITNDSLLLILPQNLLTVNKEEASSKNTYRNLQNTFRYQINKESSTKLGVELAGEYSRLNRYYLEKGEIATYYPLVNIDSSETADSIYLNRVITKAGIFLERSSLQISSNLCLEQWGINTMGRDSDTTELTLDYNLTYKAKTWRFASHGIFGLYGNFSSLDLINEFVIGMKSLNFRLNNQISRLPPSPFIRNYRGNNLDYITNSISLQQHSTIATEIRYLKSIFSFHLGSNYQQLNGVYFFNSVNWSPNLNERIDLIKVFSKVLVNSKRLSGQLSYQFTSMDEVVRYLPQHQTMLRFAIKAGLFKNARLKTMMGIDAFHLSAHKRLVFSPVMGAFDMEALSNSPILPGFYTIGAFANFNVNQFRFFARIDNISYLWMEKRIEILKGYYYPSTQFKLGITWDFWN